jgi:hypothetical protein
MASDLTTCVSSDARPGGARPTAPPSNRPAASAWAAIVVQVALLPFAGALGLLGALSGPLLTLSAGATVLGGAVLLAPAAASFALARRAGREPAALVAWATCCLQLTLTFVLSLVT